MRLSKAMQGYMIVKKGDGYSSNTLAGYQTHFNQMIQYLGDTEIEAITQDDIARFFAWLRTEYKPVRMSKNTAPLKTTTVRNAWCAVRSLFKWYAENTQDKKFTRPDLLVKKPSVSYPEITPLKLDEIEKILKACQFSSEGKRGENGKVFKMKRPTALRDILLVMLALDTGLRVTEIASLTIGDVSGSTGEVFIRPINSTKKNKSRTVYIGQVTKKALWRYLASREDDDPSNPLFLSKEGHPMNRTSIREVLVKIGKKAGVKGVYPHRFRHTFAIEYLRNGGDVFTLQRLLGHSSMDMVRHYLDIARTDIENAHKRASPVDRWHL